MKPWYADGLKFTCTECGDCCRTHGEYRWVFLSTEDIKRLADFKKVPRREFLHQWTEKGPEGMRVLKWPNEEACVFLAERNGKWGCSVYEARPEQCRTWPFWPEVLKKKVWKTEVEPFCPGAGEGRLYTLGEIRKISRGEGETGK
jgi:Fe-S-cluster containining protein